MVGNSLLLGNNIRMLAFDLLHRTGRAGYEMMLPLRTHVGYNFFPVGILNIKGMWEESHQP